MAESRIEQILRTDFIRSMDVAPVPSVSPTTPLHEVVAIMQTRRASAVVVSDAGRVVGIFTERDLMNRIIGLALNDQHPISEVMTPTPRTLSPDDRIADAIRLMTDKGYRHIPLVDADGRERGLVSARSIVEFIAAHYPKEVFNLPPDLGQVARRQEGG